MKNKLKTKIKKNIKWLKDSSDKDYEGKYQPKKFGESKSVAFEIEGLAKSFCQTTEWANGEGYDFCFQDEKGNSRRIELHLDDIQVMLAGLDHFNHFDND